MFAQRLHMLRIQHRDSQATLGNALGVAQRTVSSWESGENRPTIDMLDAIATRYEVTTDYLLGRDGTSQIHVHDIGQKDGVDMRYYSKQAAPPNQEKKDALLAMTGDPNAVVIRKPDNLPQDRAELEAVIRKVLIEALEAQGLKPPPA